MPSGLNLRQKDISVGNGINIEYSTTGSGITLSIPPMEDRLLPTGGKDGDILGYQEGVDRGNNTDTKLLIQPATSDGLIVDQAAGNAAPVSITNSGNVVIEDNALVFTGTNSLLIPANALGMTLGGNNEFMIDIEFQLDSVKSDYATLYGSDGGGSGYQGALYFTSGGDAIFTMSLGPDTTGWTLGTKHRITIERWNDNGTWKTSVYRNGSFLASSTSGMNTLSDYVFPIGSNNESTGRNFIGKIWAFRISNKAEHHGVSFAPQELPFLPPAGQPVWTEGIDRSRLLPENPNNGDIPCFDATATVGGGNDSNTVALFHFDTEIKDEAAGNAAPISATKIGTATISTDDKKFGDGSLYFNSGRLLIPVDGNRMDTDAWVASVWFKTSNTNTTFLLNQDDNTTPRWSVITDGNGLHWHVRGVGLGSNHSFPTAEWNWMAVVKDDQKHLHFYLNGAKIDTYTNSIDFTVPTFGLGGMVDTSDNRNMTGYVDEFRLQFLNLDEVAQWTGTSIAVPDAPYSKPQTVGEWSKLNKSALVQSVNGQLPDASGNVTVETNAFGEWINFEPSGQVMLTHNFNDRFAVGILQLLDADGRIYSLNDRVTYNTNYINIDYTGLLLTGTHKARFFNSSASMGGLQPPTGALALYENYSGGNWADSSGNGYDLTASGSITAQNGEAFFPDATGKLLAATNWPLGNKVTFSVVVSAQDRVCWFGCSKGILGIYNNGFTFGKTDTPYGHSAQIPTAVLSGKFHLLMTLNGTSVQYYLNGEQMELSGTDYWTTATVDGLGNVYTKYPFTSHTIAHCAIYNSILTAEDISKCWNYVKAKYNL